MMNGLLVQVKRDGEDRHKAEPVSRKLFDKSAIPVVLLVVFFALIVALLFFMWRS